MSENEKNNIIQEEEDEEVVVLVDEDGNEEEFYEIAVVEYEGRFFSCLAPVEPTEELAEDELLIYELSQNEDGEEIFNPIEDEELVDKVFAEFEKMQDAYFKQVENEKK